MEKVRSATVSEVYLEGKRALQPVDWLSEAQVTYYIGTPTSSIKINDFRQIPNLHAIQAIESQKDRENFYRVFSRPADVRIEEQEDDIIIDLTDPIPLQDQLKGPILWMGVFEGDELTANPLSWYALRETGDHRTAFVALVDNNGSEEH